MMRVSEIMSVRLVSCAPDETVGDSARRMVAAGVGSVVVCDATGLVGILTERDVLRLVAERRDFDATLVDEVMARDVAVVSPDAPVGEVASLMNQRRVRHLPVVEGGMPVGIVSLRDFFVLSGAVLRAQGAEAAGEILHAATGPRAATG
jgi:CBS domain-containing protein